MTDKKSDAETEAARQRALDELGADLQDLLHTTIIEAPKNQMPRIDAIYAFLSVDPEDGNEGIVGTRIDGVMVPLFASDAARLDSLRPLARSVAEISGMQVRLVKFTTRVVIEDSV